MVDDKSYRKKPVKSKYKGTRPIAIQRSPEKIYTRSDLLSKISSFRYKEDETFEKESAKSINVSRIEDFLEGSDNEEYQSQEEIRSPIFDERLITSRSMLQVEKTRSYDLTDFLEPK